MLVASQANCLAKFCESLDWYESALHCCCVKTEAQGLLYQATDAEAKDDREIVCSEVFADVTGSLDDNAIGKGQQACRL